MEKRKPTLKEYLNNYQTKNKSKSSVDSIRGSAISSQSTFVKIEDKIECLRTILKIKLDETTYDAVSCELEEIKTLFNEKLETSQAVPQTAEQMLSRTINRSAFGLKHPKPIRPQKEKENLEPPPNLDSEVDKLTRLEQSEVHIKDDDNLEDSGSMESFGNRKIKRLGFTKENKRLSIDYKVF